MSIFIGWRLENITQEFIRCENVWIIELMRENYKQGEKIIVRER